MPNNTNPAATCKIEQDLTNALLEAMRNEEIVHSHRQNSTKARIAASREFESAQSAYNLHVADCEMCGRSGRTAVHLPK